MDKILYDLMDWAGIEELVYSEASNPCRLLGPHVTKDGLLIQAFIPTAVDISVKLKTTGKKYAMELADEAGFFAVLIPRKSVAEYTLVVTYDNGIQEEICDPYAYGPVITEKEQKQFEAGVYYKVYEKMGAHPWKIGEVTGVLFAVWAPCAMRVSVVGDFNLWDGRRHQMEKLGDSGIFELFIPGMETGAIYKYEVKCLNGDPVLKADPYGNYCELRPNTASVVWDIGRYQWNDEEWMEQRAKNDTKDKPMSIYEVHLGSWMRKEVDTDEEGNEIIGSEFYNYREIAEKLAAYVNEMGYTHVEIMPVMEHPLDASWGYQVTGYYAPTSRYGTPDDFMYFMDYMHGHGIGVLLDWVPAHFPRDLHGLACFDGTCVYEHKDPRQGSHPHWGTLIYNYGRPQVSNFLIANALFWADKYHADGIRMDAVASMLYLDYGKNPGEWVPNIYGGHENLEAVEFLKHLNTAFKKRKDGAVLIAEESTAWPQITGNVKDGALGFDYKWNMGWMNDFTGYMHYDPFFRCHHYGELTFSLLYAYSEDFILVFSHDEVVHGKGSMAGKMPGNTMEDKFANLRAAYGFMMGHPGKKLLFMGQDFGQIAEWNENESLEWNLLEYPIHRQMKEYVKSLNQLYAAYPALSEMDYHPEGFEWINSTAAEDNIVVFLRKTRKKEETLLFVCNFAPVVHKKFKVGVPFAGKYKEIFCSDSAEFGGSGLTNGRAKSSKKDECDAREDSITIQLAPLGIHVFSCTPVQEKAALEAAPKKKTTSRRRKS
ncbi:MAG: 1,4-alpha-glucan branching protein GlgB [Clostridiaceae bacterium]|nr:1,4-alpha-glucan branching protein GlgB [Clostridiaceae bacterium]